MELGYITAAAAAEAVRKREITARELVESFLGRCTALNGRINSFIHIFEQEAMDQAEVVDERIKGGEALPLAGVPVALKDDLCYSAGPTSWGAAALKDFHPPYTAAAVEKLIAAGAVIVGKANLDPFSLGFSTAASLAGPTVNPRNPDLPAGDGAAAAVAAGQCLLALSSDSGGALRIGADRCGIFGLRPTTGLVSRHGLCTAAPSFARVGIAAREAADIELALQAIAGYDPRDAATAAVKEGIPAAQKRSATKELKIGFPEAVFDLLPEVDRASLEKSRAKLEASGAAVMAVELPLFQEALHAYCVIAAAEASSNLGRFDGIRFGIPEAEANMEDWYHKTRGRIFDLEAKRRSIFGTHLLSGENFDAYYRQAQKVWKLVRRSFAAALEHCDLLVLPVAVSPGNGCEAGGDFLASYQEKLFCAPVSLSGLPALCVPAGDGAATAAGLQLVGKPFGEAALIALADRAAL